MSTFKEDAADNNAPNLTEDKKLLDKISEISGRINRHKNSAFSQSEIGHAQQRGRYTPHSSMDSWRSPRIAPYHKEHGRHRGHRNRTLVLNKNGNTSSADNDMQKQGHTPSPEVCGWVTKRDRHMQLINPSVYDKETRYRSRAMEETRRQKALHRDQREKQQIQNHLHARNALPGPTPTTPIVHELEVDGIRFQVLNGGSKLARIRGSYSGNSTPKQADIGGVTFFRSKHGNLYRSGIVKAKKELPQGEVQAAPYESATSEDGDIVSEYEEEMDSDDMDSDGLEEIMGTDDAASHALSQQQDYVGF
ncbi:MAG: hypothetical protein Q9217_001651 [Psora testacea]